MNDGLFARILDKDQATAQVATYRAYPTLKSARWILPATRIQRRSGISIYRPTSALGRMGKSLIYFGLMRGEAAPAATEPLDRLRRFVSESIGVSNISVGLAFGTKGAYQKNTLRIMTKDGTPIAYAKLADQELSKRKIAAEYSNLTYLNSIPDLKRYIPEVNYFGEFEDCLMLVTSAGPDRPGPLAFSREHENFLCTLFSISRIEKPLLEADLWVDIMGTMDWLSSRASQAWLDRFDQHIRFVRSELGGTPIPLSMAHRDFTPWNTCLTPDGGLFVFDWEVAVRESPPLQDFFHFHVLPHVMAGCPYNVDVKVAQTLASRILGLPNIKEINVDALFAFYLIDIASYYLEASLKMPGAGTATVLTWAGREMDARMEKKHA